MGKFADRQKETREIEERLLDRQARLRARMESLKARARERYSAGALVVAGLALGVAVDQFVRLRAAAHVRNARLRGRRPAPPPITRPTIPLISMLQFLLTAFLAPRPRRSPAAPPMTTPHAHSARSSNLADHSSALTGQGLTRH